MEGERDLSDRHGHAPDGAAAGLQGLHEAGRGGRQEDWLHRQPAGEFMPEPSQLRNMNSNAGAHQLAC